MKVSHTPLPNDTIQFRAEVECANPSNYFIFKWYNGTDNTLIQHSEVFDQAYNVLELASDDLKEIKCCVSNSVSDFTCTVYPISIPRRKCF